MINYIGISTIINIVIFVLILLFRKQGFKEANRFLAIFLLQLGHMLAVLVMWNLGLASKYYLFTQSDYLSFSLLGYTFYTYASAMALETFKWKPIKIIHFIPFIFAICYFINFQSKPVAEKIVFIDGAYVHFPAFELAMSVFFSLVCIFYFVLSYYKIKAYRKKVKTYFSDIQSINIEWLNNFLLIFSGIFIFISTSLNLLPPELKQVSNLVVGIPTIAIFYIFIFAKTINHPFAFSALGHKQMLEELNSFQIVSRQETAPKNDATEKLYVEYQKLMHTIETDKLYRIQKLTIKQLSQKTQVPVTVLSKIIQYNTGHNYFTFINSYRVKEAQNMLLLPEMKNLTIDAIGKECGFNSSASFFSVFKKTTDTTPTIYRQQHFRVDA